MTTETPNPADGATPASGGRAAGTADFDALLAEYTQGTKPEPKADVSKVLDGLKPVIEFANTELSNRHNEALKKDLNAAIEFVKEEEAAKDIPPTVVRGMLELYASEHEEFAKAFQNRSKDKATWQAQLAEARKYAVTELKGLSPSTRVASDVAAARAAVSGEASKPPPKGDGPTPQQMLQMPEREWRALIASQLKG